MLPQPGLGRPSESRARTGSGTTLSSVRKGLCRRGVVASLAAVVARVTAAFAVAGSTALILPTHTPGARFSKVTRATISSTICVMGWTKTIRPPQSYTNALKKAQLAEWHYADQNPTHYEEDHLISLELGGAPRSKKNLWPEPWPQAHKSDPRENAWHRQVCNATLTLRRAQKQELAYKRTRG
jgi:hypothetical protein